MASPCYFNFNSSFMFHSVSASPNNELIFPSSWLKMLKRNMQNYFLPTYLNIVGGKNALPGQYPYQVLMRTVSADGKVRANSGALITDRHVLTAAHCLYDVDRVLLAFGTVHPSISSGIAVDYVSRDSVVVHPDFNSVSLENDIAIVKLNQSLGGLKTIRLPKIGKSDPIFYEGKKGIVTGWGYTSNEEETSAIVLQAAKVKIMRQEAARSYFQLRGYTLMKSQLCTNFTKTKSGSGPGDSGGPLLVREKDRRPTILGIISFGHKKCIADAPSVYTNVAAFLPWIAKETGIKMRKRR